VFGVCQDRGDIGQARSPNPVGQLVEHHLLNIDGVKSATWDESQGDGHRMGSDPRTDLENALTRTWG
jgi:hypothetical protein